MSTGDCAADWLLANHSFNDYPYKEPLSIRKNLYIKIFLFDISNSCTVVTDTQEVVLPKKHLSQYWGLPIYN